MVVPIFNVVFVSEEKRNAINNGNYVLFHLWKCSDKRYGNVVLIEVNWNEHLNFHFEDV